MVVEVDPPVVIGVGLLGDDVPKSQVLMDVLEDDPDAYSAIIVIWGNYHNAVIDRSV